MERQTVDGIGGVVLFAVGSWRAQLLPRWLLVVWPIAWAVGSITFGGPSTGGSGLIKLHTGKVTNLPDGVTKTVIA